jgi:hypothetical protein
MEGHALTERQLRNQVIAYKCWLSCREQGFKFQAPHTLCGPHRPGEYAFR